MERSPTHLHLIERYFSVIVDIHNIEESVVELLVERFHALLFSVQLIFCQTVHALNELFFRHLYPGLQTHGSPENLKLLSQVCHFGVGCFARDSHILCPLHKLVYCQVAAFVEVHRVEILAYLVDPQLVFCQINGHIDKMIVKCSFLFAVCQIGSDESCLSIILACVMITKETGVLCSKLCSAGGLCS